MSTRVWERFLTARDKAALNERPHQVWGYGTRPALVLVDLYRWVFGDERTPLLDAIKEWPSSCGEAGWDAIPHLQRLLAAARAARIPVVHVTGLPASESGVTSWSTAPDGSSTAPYSDVKPDPQKFSRRFDIIDEVAPVAGEAVLRKAAPSAFFGTLLTAHLNALGVDGVILCGESTSGCVRATCVDAKSYRFKVTVVEECVFDRNEAAHAINLFDMHEKYADVLSIDEVVAHLETLRPLAAAGV